MKIILQIRSRIAKLASKNLLYKPVFIVIGLVSLLWFLFRVIPKPSRASYPCMQTAFPIASSFVLWLVGSLGSIAFFKKIPIAIKNRNYVKLAAFSLAGVMLLLIATTFNNESISFASAFGKQEEIVSVKKDYGTTVDALKTKVSVVKSTKELVTDINYADILSMVREAVNLAGGLEHLITDGKTVMLKPNIVNDYPNRTIEANGATTDYRVVQAVVEIIRELNPSVKIILAEGSASDIPTMTNFERLKYTEIPGIDYMMSFEAYSGEYRDYQSDSLVSVDLPDSLSKYPDELKPNKSRTLYFNKQYYNADVVISIPVLKNHANAGVTGGVKNVAIGCTPANIYADKDNDRPYLRSPVIIHTDGYLNKFIHDYYVARPVDFVIMDGLQGGSNGPGVGANNLTLIKKHQHNMRLILAGKDAVATDAVAGLIIGHDPQRAPHLIYIHNSGYGTVDPALIDVVGVKVHTVRKAFGFENQVATQTAFDKFSATNYLVSGIISNNTLNMSVSNPEDLARMQVKVDNQPINKYVVGDFNNISLNLDGIHITDGVIDVYFEDRYLNPLSKQFTAEIQTSVLSPKNSEMLLLYPNPVNDILNITLNNGDIGIYKMQIVDMTGKVMVTSAYINSTHSFNHTLNLKKLTQGNYLFKLVYPDGSVQTRRLFKR